MAIGIHLDDDCVSDADDFPAPLFPLPPEPVKRTVRLVAEAPAEMADLFKDARWEKVSPGHRVRAVYHKGIRLEQHLYFCRDCRRKNPVSFMVNDALWAAAGLKKAGVICVECFEKRIGRRIKSADLRVCKMNALALHLLRRRDVPLASDEVLP